MIKLIDNFDEYDFSSFEDDVFFQRIYSDYMSLSVFENVMFYVCENDTSTEVVISKIDGNVTVSAKDNASFEEIKEFLNIVGFSKILCDRRFSCFFDGTESHGCILKLKSDEIFNCKAVILDSDHLKNMYLLVEKVFETKNDFLPWVADLSHRLRHNSATLCGIYSDEKIVSGAFSLFETEKSAVISSVATHYEARHKGYGEDVVKALLNKNFSKTVYVFTENEITEKWYKKMGFTSYKMWSEIENVL